MFWLSFGQTELILLSKSSDSVKTVKSVLLEQIYSFSYSAAQGVKKLMWNFQTYWDFSATFKSFSNEYFPFVHDNLVKAASISCVVYWPFKYHNVSLTYQPEPDPLSAPPPT